ncbi:hypothetical protein [Streptococcus sp.]|jgi:hypothetical protein|uniref:hypothetical protein n=1 Tax=Streptococcus sp. TaxID=1306 RepID=UPI00391DD52F
MKTLGKVLANKIATIIILVILFGGAFWYVKGRVGGGTTSSEYSFVIKRFSKKNQLLIADADVATTSEKQFDAELTKDWPEWTKWIADVIVSRKVVMEIPVKTEFKLELEGLDKDDIHIENQVLTFKKSLTVYVDSQKNGETTIKNSSSGLLDMGVDLITGSKKAMEFLEEKSQDAIYATSENVMNDMERREKVAKYAEEALENLLNLNSEQKIDVKIDVENLNFENID